MRTEAELEEALARPTADLVDAMAQLHGDLIVLGAGGKMGPSLARLARNADRAAGVHRTIYGVSRFAVNGPRAALDKAGIETIACDLLDPTGVSALPDGPNVVYMVGQKFGTAADPPATWATNAVAAGIAAARYRSSRIVAFSTGNVYPFVPVDGPGAGERDQPAPVGEYALSALARERVFTHYARIHQTPMVLLRLNYAVELRYGVLRDLADAVRQGAPIDLRMGYVNVIWQRDANAVALRALARGTVPPLILNVTGTRHLAVRELAARFGERLGIAPQFAGTEPDTALLSDATRSVELFGEPPTPVDEVIDWVADWVARGGRSLERPTHFSEREGHY